MQRPRQPDHRFRENEEVEGGKIPTLVARLGRERQGGAVETARTTAQVVLDVPGIHCDGCISTIREAVACIEGAVVVAGDARARRVTVDYDPALASPADLQRELANRGFPVRAAVGAATETPQARSARPLGWVLLAVGLAAVLAAGGYYAGFQGFVYGVAMPNAFDRLGVVPVGLIAGVAAFFSPCVFPLLPAYASYYLMAGPVEDRSAGRRQLGKSLRLGGAAALGVIAVDVIIGAVIVAIGAASPFEGDPREEAPFILFVRFLAGLGIALLGARALLGRHRSQGLLARIGSRVGERARPGGGVRGFFLYGITYNAAGLGCTGPILLGVMLYYALVSERALAAFAVFTGTMGLLMVVVAVLVGVAASAPVLRLREAAPVIQKVGAVMLLTLGTYTMLIQSFGAGRELFVQVFLRFLL